MRPCFVLLCLFVVFLDVPKLIAQVPPAPWNTGGVPQMESVTVLEPPPPPVDPYHAVGPQAIETEVFLGLPSELRVQWAYLRGQNVALMLEGIIGAETSLYREDFFPFGIAAVGGRIRWAAYNGERNAFVVKPGADLYALFRGSAAGGPLGGADVELLWWHNCGPQNRFGFVLGADVGLLVFIGPGLVGGIPLVSGIFGFHF